MIKQVYKVFTVEHKVSHIVESLLEELMDVLEQIKKLPPEEKKFLTEKVSLLKDTIKYVENLQSSLHNSVIKAAALAENFNRLHYGINNTIDKEFEKHLKRTKE
jgi:sugar-specific transcriptional regulator TrmB